MCIFWERKSPDTLYLRSLHAMNKPIVIVLALVAAGLGGLAFTQSQSAARVRASFAETEARLEAQAARDAGEIARLNEKIAIFKSEADQLRKRNAEAPAVAVDENGKTPLAGDPNAKPKNQDKGGGWMKGLAKMFKDPEMRKMMRGQQGVGVRMMYGDLAKELGITPDDANQVMELLTDRQMDASSKAMNAVDDSGDAAKLAASAEDAQKVVTDYDAKLKNILGEDRTKKLNDYERTLGDRMAIQQYSSSFSSAGVPLDETQKQGLLNVMKEERLKQPPGPLDPGAKDVGAQMKAMRTGEGLDEALASQRDMNQRVLTRARTVLTPDQMAAFETAQKAQMEMQEMGIKMAKGMFGKDEEPLELAPPVPVEAPITR